MNNPVVQLIAGTIHGLVATITEIASIALVLRAFVAELVAMIPRFMAPPPGTYPPCPDPCPYYIRGGGAAP